LTAAPLPGIYFGANIRYQLAGESMWNQAFNTSLKTTSSIGGLTQPKPSTLGKTLLPGSAKFCFLLFSEAI